MKALEKFDRAINFIRITLLVIILIAVIGMCTMNIVLHYLIKGVPWLRPFPWVNELMQVGTIWIVFLAAGLGVKSGSHISLESLTEKFLPAKVSKVLRKIAQLVVLVTLAILIYFGVIQAINEAHSYLQNIHISNGWFYAAIPVGCAYLFYDYLLIFLFGKHPFAKTGTEKEPTSGAF